MRKSAIYALDGMTPIRHAVTVLGGALRPLSPQEMAANYKHSVPGDLTRIKKHEGCANDTAARVWLMRYAVSELGKQVEEINGCFSLRLPVEDVRYNGNPVALLVDEEQHWPGGNRPFDPMSGAFACDIRRSTEDTDELRESLREFGWLDEHPAIRDERGVILVGHRRLKVAAELGIEPRIVTLSFGNDKAGDAARARMAIGSNLGNKPMSAADRRRLAEYFHGEGWSLAQIGRALNVTKKTVSQDLTFGRVTQGNAPESPTVALRATIVEHLKTTPNGLTFAQLRERIGGDYQTEDFDAARRGLTRQKLITKIGEQQQLGVGRPAAVWCLAEVEPASGSINDAVVVCSTEPPVIPEPAAVKPPAQVAKHKHIWICSVCGQTKE